MIEINIRVRGTLKRPFGKAEMNYSCEQGLPIEDLLRELGYKENHLPLIMVSVNDELKDHHYSLQNKDRILLFASMGGG